MKVAIDPHIFRSTESSLIMRKTIAEQTGSW